MSYPVFIPTSFRWPLPSYNNTHCHIPSSHLPALASSFLCMHKSNTMCTHNITYTLTINVTHTVSVALWYTFFKHQSCDWYVTHDQVRVTIYYMRAFRHTYHLHLSFIQRRIKQLITFSMLILGHMISSFNYYDSYSYIRYLVNEIDYTAYPWPGS